MTVTERGVAERDSTARDLTERERSVLDLERTWWQRAPTKAEAIRARLGISPARYYQVLAGVVDRAEALNYDPLVVRRIRRSRLQRRRARFEGRPAGAPGAR